MDDARSLRAGDVAAVPLPGGLWGTCLVTAADRSGLTVCALAGASSAPSLPSSPEPLRLTHHAHRGGPAQHTIPLAEPVPPWFEWLGRVSFPATLREPPNSFASWSTITDDLAAQHRWDALPEPARAAYRTPRDSTADFGAGPLEPGPWRRTELDLTTISLPAEPRWDALDRLPRCTRLTWRGPGRGLAAALARRPLISTLTWHETPAGLDLSATALTDVTVSGDDLGTLRLPPGCRSLTVTGGSGPAVVVAAPPLVTLRDGVPVPAGLAPVRELALDVGGTAGLTPLGALAGLQRLRVTFRDPPGSITGAGVLASLARLRVLELTDAYALDAAALPELPALTHLGVRGLRRSAVAPLRTKFPQARVVLTGATNDTRPAGDPWRDWVDDDARGGAAACKAYATALRALDHLPPETPARRHDAEGILRTLVDKLNAIDNRHETIDTTRRGKAPEAAELSDAWRDW